MFNILNCECSSKWAGCAPLILRLATGVIFAMHGYQKLSGGLEGTTGMLTSLGFPIASVFAVILIAVELLGGIALIVGFMTHWAAKLTAIVAAVALFTVHVGNGFFMQTGGYEFILLLLAASLSLMITGPGKWSIDGLMRRSTANPTI